MGGGDWRGIGAKEEAIAADGECCSKRAVGSGDAEGR